MTYTVEQFGKDISSKNVNVDMVVTNVNRFTAETITSEGDDGDGVLHIAFDTGDKAIVKAVLAKVSSLNNPNDIIKKLLARVNYAGFTSFIMLAGQVDSTIRDILDSLFREHNKEFSLTILSDTSSLFGNSLEHILAVKGKAEALMTLVDYKMAHNIEFNKNRMGDYFYFELCRGKRYGIVNQFLDKISNNTGVKATVLSNPGSNSETLLYKAITAYEKNNTATDEFLSKVFAMVDAVDELQNLFSENVKREFVKEINLLPKLQRLKDAAAFRNDSNNSKFEQFLTTTGLIDGLVQTLDQAQDKYAIQEGIKTFVGEDLPDQAYKAIFYGDADAKTYSSLTRLLQISSDYNFLKNIVCPAIARAMAKERYITLGTLDGITDLEMLKSNVTIVNASLPDNFGQCNPILIKFIGSIELQQTARALEGGAEKLNGFQTTLKACIKRIALCDEVFNISSILGNDFVSLDGPCKENDSTIKVNEVGINICEFSASRHKLLQELAENTVKVEEQSNYCKGLSASKKAAQSSNQANMPICKLPFSTKYGITISVFKHFLNTHKGVYDEVIKETTQNLVDSLHTLNSTVDFTGKDFPQCLSTAVTEANNHLRIFCFNVRAVSSTEDFMFGNVTLTQNSTSCTGEGGFKPFTGYSITE